MRSKQQRNASLLVLKRRSRPRRRVLTAAVRPKKNQPKRVPKVLTRLSRLKLPQILPAKSRQKLPRLIPANLSLLKRTKARFKRLISVAWIQPTPGGNAPNDHRIRPRVFWGSTLW